MNATAHIAEAFLKGRVLSIKKGFRLFGVTNMPREVGRLIERRFKIKVNRTWKAGFTRYNIPCSWIDYRLVPTKRNLPARKRMRKYINEQKQQDQLIAYNQYLKKRKKK